MRKQLIGGLAFISLLISGGATLAASTPSEAATVPGRHAALVPGVNTSADPAMRGIELPPLDYNHPLVGVHAAKGKPERHDKTTKGRPAVAPAGTLSGCSGYCYAYAGGYQSAASVGSAVTIRLAKPTLSTTGTPHSLAEKAVQNTVTGDIIEVGSTVDPAVCGSLANSPCLFGFNWVGSTPGCYNGCGFVTASGCTPCLGGSLAGAVATSKVFRIEHIGTAWWLSYNGVYQAAMPDTDWTSSRFTSSDYTQDFFEVAENDNTPCTKMGDGILASASTGAYFINYALIGSGSAPDYTAFTSITGTGTALDATKFTAVKNSATYVRGGGPMWQPCP